MPAAQALRRAVYAVSLPNRVIMALPPGRELPADHPAHGKGLVEGRAGRLYLRRPGVLAAGDRSRNTAGQTL